VRTEELCRALHTPPDEPPGALDIEKIIVVGAQMQRRRRIAVIGGAMLATVAMLVGITTITQFRVDTTELAQQPTPTASVPEAPAVAPAGDVIPTGIRDVKGELVLYMYLMDGLQPPHVQFGVAAGHRTPSGEVVPGVANNETRGILAETPGFHSIMGGNDETGVFLPAFGYYSGPAARIEATVQGKTVRARVAMWSVKKDIVIFWFPQEAVPDARLLSRPVAYDAKGNRLS
jgi:hypothetical protein